MVQERNCCFVRNVVLFMSLQTNNGKLLHHIWVILIKSWHRDALPAFVKLLNLLV